MDAKMKVIWVTEEGEEKLAQELPAGARININGVLTLKALEQEIISRLQKYGCVLAFGVRSVPSLMEWGAHLANTGRKQ
ncbi:hypothetical protein LCGC14_1666780 [marine sediment metagenome]|uniref:Uncharacterized protein n=1 Tax=marine sediment metagenome TaxID=412755 RepID=A0A0F9HSE1_9ZZZZ